MHPNRVTEEGERQLSYAVIALDVRCDHLHASTNDIAHAVETQFGFKPIRVTCFKSDFIIQCKSSAERDCLTSTLVLSVNGLDAILVAWSNTYGAKKELWQTKVSIDIEGFPPHMFNRAVLENLLGCHMSIETHSFSEDRAVCRVNGYARSADSIPRTGEVGFKYPSEHGCIAGLFPVTLTTYNYGDVQPYLYVESPKPPIEPATENSNASVHYGKHLRRF